MYRTLITPRQLLKNVKDPDWAVFDCRFNLDDPGEGRRLYYKDHIPGSLYAHLDEDLSGEIIPGKTGRHPLPEVDEFARTMSAWGVDRQVQVVAYDARGGAIAARLWWMLKWLGHEKAAVLEGGYPAWQKAGYPMEEKISDREERKFTPQPRPQFMVDVDKVDMLRNDDGFVLLDARDEERYRGEEEPMDPVAGHIPGALSAPYAENLTSQGKFRTREELRQRYDRILEEKTPQHAVFYCGSGVTSAHNILAMIYAGYDMPRLYPGSWSEWITDPSRPVA